MSVRKLLIISADGAAGGATCSSPAWADGPVDACHVLVTLHLY